jgi:hypothetical protein
MTSRRVGKFRCIACGRVTVQPVDEGHPGHEIRSWCCGCSLRRVTTTDSRQFELDRLHALLENITSIIRKWNRPSHIRLHAGEMTAREMCSVVVVMEGLAADVDAALNA